MEENDVIKEGKKQGSYITGIIGAVIGGLIAAVPWVVCYVQFNMILSVLSIVIALGALKGYELFKGRMSKAVKPIIVIISLLVVVFATAGVIPFWLAEKYSRDLGYLYQSSEFINALMQDLAVSVIFTIVGLSVAISHINKVLAEYGIQDEKDKEVAKKAEELRNVQIYNKLKPQGQVELDAVRKAFQELDAYNINSSVEKEAIMAKLSCDNPEKTFDKFMRKRIIKKYGNKYYYLKDNEILLVNKGTWLVWFIVAMVVIGVIVGVAGDGTTRNNNSNTTKNNSTYGYNKNNSSTTKTSTKKKDFTIKSGAFKMQIPENWKDETVAGVSTMLTDPTGNAAVVFIEVGKEDLIEGITLEEVMDSVKEYSYSMYKPEKEAGEPSSCKVGNYNAYKTSYNTTYTGYKFKLTAYAVETDGYFVQLYTLALSSKAEENEKIFEEILKTIEEVK